MYALISNIYEIASKRKLVKREINYITFDFHNFSLDDWSMLITYYKFDKYHEIKKQRITFVHF